MTATDIAHRTLRRVQINDQAVGSLTFEDFCARFLVIQDKRGQVVPLRLNRAQRELITQLTGRDLVLKARQLGMSTAIQAWLFWKQLRGHVRTTTLCHEDDLTATLRRMTDRFYDNLPVSIRPDRKYANAKVTTYPALVSEGSIATVGGQAGQRKGRGSSVTHIHGSEVAYWPDAEGVLTAALQAGNPAIILESTPNGMSGWFYEQCMEALDSSSWTLHFFPWWYDDDYRVDVDRPLAYSDEEKALADRHGLVAEQIAWRRTKQRELKDKFLQEYAEDPLTCFLASGNSFFGDVQHVFCAPSEPGPQPGHRYVAGLDFGQSKDWTVLIILDADEMRMAAMLRINQRSWLDMRADIVAAIRHWTVECVVAETNSIGSVNIEELGRQDVVIVPFQTTAQSKPPLIQGLRYMLDEGGLTLLDEPVLRHELRSFVSKQLPSGAWQYAAQDGAHDDTVIALALAVHGAAAHSHGIWT